MAILPLMSQAQGRAVVSGTVGDAQGVSQQFVTVTLHRAADSAVVKTEFTDIKGAFQLSAAANGRYLISAAQVGFRRYWSPAFTLPATGVALPAVRLAAGAATILKDITVTGHQPLYERLADRTVVHVAESPLAAGSTTLDVLGRAPNVTLSSSSDLRLRGREGLLVYLDGKRVPLTGQDLTDYLSALPAEQIQTIELITNPPASYDALGMAGVIDIKLKKDQRLGLNGSANASYGRGVYGKFVGGGSLNYRRKSLNLYGTYTYSDRRGFYRYNFDRQFAATAGLPASSQQFTEQLTDPRAHSAKMGLDLTLSKRTLLGISATGLLTQNDIVTNSEAQFHDDKGKLSSRYTATAPQAVSQPTGSLNLNVRHAFADSATARALSADIDYAHYRTTRLLDLYTFFETPMQATTLLTSDQRSNLSIGAAKIDYSQPLPHRARLEAGAKVTQVVSRNDALFVYTAGGKDKRLADLSYPFRYRENVNAAYLNLHGGTARTTLQAGLRAEQTNTQADTAGWVLRDYSYFKLFPSVLVQHTLNNDNSLAVSVARRIDRPNYSLVNPLRAYLDPTSYSTGNYNLLPSTSYNFELTHTYKGKFSTALAYARVDQPYVRVVQPAADGSPAVVNQFVNLDAQYFYTLNLIAPLDLTKWWTLYANVLLAYNRYQGNLNGTALDRGRVAFNLTASNSFTLPSGWTAELSGLYESREVVGYQLTQDRGQVAIGFQKSIWKKQATLRLNVADVFYTTPIRATSTYDTFTETFYQRRDLRVVTAALTYRFGNSKVAAARKRAAGAEEELRRAGE